MELGGETCSLLATFFRDAFVIMVLFPFGVTREGCDCATPLVEAGMEPEEAIGRRVIESKRPLMSLRLHEMCFPPPAPTESDGAGFFFFA
jgi:hypothetical protein